MIKKIGIYVGAFLILLTVLFFILTDSVDHTSYFDSAYFKNTSARLDSLKKTTLIVNDSLQAGFAKVSITPNLNSSTDNVSKGEFRNVPLAGFGARKGKAATGIHDSIFIKAVALKVNHQTVILVGADLLIMPPNIIDSVTYLLSQKGIRREQLYISATHTHSSLGGWGPGFVGEQFAGNENKNIASWHVLQISTAVNSAIADLHPASIGTGSFNAAIIPGTGSLANQARKTMISVLLPLNKPDESE